MLDNLSLLKVVDTVVALWIPYSLIYIFPPLQLSLYDPQVLDSGHLGADHSSRLAQADGVLYPVQTTVSLTSSRPPSYFFPWS